MLRSQRKILLSRLPISYDLLRRPSLFRHGAMDVPQCALEAVRSMIQAAGYEDRLDGLSVLELGPGDSLATALIAHALGARQAVLVDAGACRSARGRGYPHRGGQTRANTDALLKATGTR